MKIKILPTYFRISGLKTDSTTLQITLGFNTINHLFAVTNGKSLSCSQNRQVIRSNSLEIKKPSKNKDYLVFYTKLHAYQNKPSFNE